MQRMMRAYELSLTFAHNVHSGLLLPRSLMLMVSDRSVSRSFLLHFKITARNMPE